MRNLLIVLLLTSACGDTNTTWAEAKVDVAIAYCEASAICARPGFDTALCVDSIVAALPDNDSVPDSLTLSDKAQSSLEDCVGKLEETSASACPAVYHGHFPASCHSLLQEVLP